jgi:glycerol-3-phosphate acyltransferase PlsX
VGNVCLKLAEGMVKNLTELMRREVMATPLTKMGALLLKPTFKGLKQRMDYAQYGGAPLLGINGVAYICHGASSPEAIASAVRLAMHSVQGNVTEHLTSGLEQYRGLLLGEAGEL